MMVYVFIHSLIGKIYKILPLKEELDMGQDVHLSEYISSLLLDFAGALESFPELSTFTEFITIVNILQYLNTHHFDHRTCKREVFKMISLLEKIEERMGGEIHE